MWLITLWTALAAPTGPAAAVEARPEEVLVYTDRFARWDHTRWYAETQIGFATPWVLYAQVNHEVRFSALQLRADIACAKTWRSGRKGYEVRCPIEQISVRGVTMLPDEPHADLVLQELDDLLTGATLELKVTEDGRLTDVGLLGPKGRERRSTVIRENARQLMVQLMSNFNLRLPKENALAHDNWVEYGSSVFQPPTLSVVTTCASLCPPGTEIDALKMRPKSTYGGTTLVHQLTPYRGRLVLQSTGSGVVSDGYEEAEKESFFDLHFDGVSVFDPATGIMTERVYAMRGESTAGSAIAQTGSGVHLFHTGRIQLLDGDATVPTGFTGRVVEPKDAATHPDLPVWVAME